MLKKLLLSVMLLAGCFSARAYTKADIAPSLVMNQGWVRYPSYSDRSGWNTFLGDYSRILVSKGEALLGYKWIVIPPEDYMAYETRGDRYAMEDKQQANSEALGALLVAELAEGKGRFLKDIATGVDFFCDQTSWAVSCHLAKYQKCKSPLPDPNENILALYQGNISQLMSWIHYFVGTEIDAIRPGLKARLRTELQKRELDPYLQRDDFQWMGFKPVKGKILNNWNPWCNMNALICFGLLEQDRETLATAVEKSIRSVDLYLNTLFPDGCCDEGTTYWYKSTGHLLDYLEVLEMMTGGHVSRWKEPQIQGLGEFIVNADIGNRWQVNFADGSPSRRPISYWIYRFGRAAGNKRMSSFAVKSYKTYGSNPEDVDWTLFYQGLEAVSACLEMKRLPMPQYSPAPFVLYPDCQVCFERVGGAFLAVKGGSNFERHNHNDVGSCIYFYDGKPVLIDAGVGTYNKDTFGSGRYGNWFVQSGWHNLPSINGCDQSFGKEYHSSSFKASKGSRCVSVDIAGAYPAEAKVKSWTIDYKLSKDGSLDITHNYSLSEASKASELHFMVNDRPCLASPGVISLSDGLYLKYDSSLLEATIERKSIAGLGFSSRWGDNLYRICLKARSLATKGSYVLRIEPAAKEESMASLTDRVLKIASQQAVLMDKRTDADKMPRALNADGSVMDSRLGAWTSGFFPGSCWMLYKLTGDSSFKDIAHRRTMALGDIFNYTLSHDLGFQIGCSYVNGYKLTGEEQYLPMIKQASAALAARFNPKVGATLSWDSGSRGKYPVIIDNMMNLELLEYSSKLFSCDSLHNIATTHANTTIKNHFRPDYTTWHMVDYDPETGEIIRKGTVQGYSDESVWARGQAWALYGYTMMYRETGEKSYLSQAAKVARVLLDLLPDDGIPYWDFSDPKIPSTYRDASAAAVMCSAFIELSTLLSDSSLAGECLAMAERQLRTLSSDEYLAKVGENGNFLLKHSVGNLPSGAEVDVPLAYADYYFLEALDRYRSLGGGASLSSRHIASSVTDNTGKEWTYKKVFSVDENLLSANAVYLRADNVDTFCDIAINGQNVGSASNRFRLWKWDVKPYLEKGVNTLEARFHDADKESQKAYESLERPLRMNGAGNHPHIHLIRKPIIHGGWDFAPEMMISGFVGDASLEAVNVALPEYLRVSQDHSRKGKCIVRLDAEIFSPAGGETLVELRCADQVKKKKVKLVMGVNQVSQEFVIKEPKLWWPAGMGEQPLYDVSVSAEGRTIAKKTGLRSIEVGDNLAIKVNGKPFMAKGANWVPCDLDETAQTKDRYVSLLSSVKEANMNMLRVWGGGKYENEVFYETCDSLGILVWQDMMFCCAMYPTTDEFFSEVRSELNHQIKRLQSHPCIALWCGDNEGLDCMNWRLAKTDPEYYRSEYEKLIDFRGELVKELDPGRIYWPTSPCGGPGDLDTNGWKDDSKGDMHLWDISKFARPLQKYFDFRPRFCSEFGHSSFGGPHGTLEELKAGINESNGFENIQQRIRQHFNPIEGNLDNMVYLSQMEQALGLETAISYWKSQQGCNGVLVWQLNDTAPGTSWAVVEHDGTWKPAMYHLKRLFDPSAPAVDTVALKNFVEPKDLDLRAANVTVKPFDRNGEWVVNVSTDAPAYYVWLSAPGIPGHFSDNSFTLLPGEPREVVFKGSGSFAAFASALKVTHLYEQTSPRSETLLRDWEFTDSTGVISNVRIPHDWAITGPFDKNNDLQYDSKGGEKPGLTGGLPWVGKGKYTATFSVPQGKNVSILFDGAMSHPTVYINGKEAGHWVNGYSAVPLDITSFVKPGEDNVVEVQLENLPKSSRWYPGAGLYRNVHLIATDPVHIPVWGTRVTTPSVSASSASVVMDISLEGVGSQDIVCVTDIIDKDGRKVASAQGKGAASFTQEFTVENPLLWSPSSPNLYKAVTSVYADGRLADQYETSFGIRKAEFIEKKGFFLNGEQIQFKGVCLHHDQGPLGAAVSRAALRHQLSILKDMGCNAIRTSHNQPAPELVRLCDEMGFMMMVEAFDEWKSEKCENGYHLYFDEWAEKDLVGMIRCFRNSPSVVMWSIGNEVCRKEEMDEGLAEAKMLSEICHREDPTRPVTAGMNKVIRYTSKSWRSALDIIGVNYNLKRFLTVKKNVGDRMILWTESGSTLSSRGVYHLPAQKKFDNSQSEDHQCSSFDLESCSWSNIPDDDLAIQEDYPWDLGQFIWTGFDYLGEPTPYEDASWPNHSSMFGIVDLASIPKDRFYLMRSAWNKSEHTLHVVPHWNWQEGQKVPVYAYTDGYWAELYINGKFYGMRNKRLTMAKTENPREERNETRFRLIWEDVPFEPGELKIISYDTKYNAIDTVCVYTAGDPAGIRLDYDGRRLKADGEDLAYVTVNIVDKDGNICPMADSEVHFEVSGPGSFKSCANGDPTCTEPFQNPGMHAFNGKLTAIVQSSSLEAGKITLRASSAGLKPATIVIRSNF